MVTSVSFVVSGCIRNVAIRKDCGCEHQDDGGVIKAVGRHSEVA